MVFLSPFLFWTPARGSKRPAGLSIDVPEPAARGDAAQSPLIWAALVATLIFFSGASAMWAFLERIGAYFGHDTAAVGVLLSVTLVTALIGSLTAAVIGGRYGIARPFIAGAVVFLASLAVLDFGTGFALYALGACGITFAIGFMLPLAITEVADLDVDGRFVVLSVPAIGIGAMTGPAIAGLLTTGGNYGPLIWFCAATVIIATVLIVIGASLARRKTLAK
jgi:predicted MFS family arabinose efflux permease